MEISIPQASPVAPLQLQAEQLTIAAPPATGVQNHGAQAHDLVSSGFEAEAFGSMDTI